MSPRLALRARTLPALAALALFLGTAGHVHADGTIGGGTIAMDIQLANSDGVYVDVSNQDIIEFFNLAHCVCTEQKFAVKMQLVNVTGTTPNVPVEVWVGTGCDIQQPERDAKCFQLDGFDDVDQLLTPQKYEIPVHTFMFPPTSQSTGACEAVEGSQASSTVYAWVEDGDPNDAVFDSVFSVEVLFDTKPPPLPENPVAQPGERGINVDWETPTLREEDVFQYQLLCARVGAADPVDGFPRDDPEYETSTMLCGDDGDGVVLVDPDQPGNDGGVDDAEPPRSDAAVDAGPPADADLADADPADARPPPDADDTDAGPDAAPTFDANTDPFSPIHGLDQGFVCGTKAGTNFRITGLENGVAYHVGLVSIDQSRNAAGVYLGTFTPEAVTDFWEDYHDQGGDADGGICLVTATYGDDHPFTTALRDFRDHTLSRFALGRALIDLYYATIDPLARLARDFWPVRLVVAVVLTPLVFAAALWEYTGPLGKLLFVLLVVCWRRRHGRAPRAALATAAATALLFAMAIPARAQPSPYSPYWDSMDEPDDSLGPTHLNWNFEFKLGPYLPVVDSEFDLPAGETGPFQAMFGKGSSTMGILELQRFFLWPAGQLGVAASVGVMGKTARAYTDRVDADGNPIRAEGDNTSFRLVPTALSAVYRYTYLDDRWGIPLVPYGKLGLSYYLWWITDPNGDLARVPKSPECTDIYEGNCASDRALGASMGWQGALGLSIRAERIDPQAALNLRNEMGIEHAGFFAEVLYARVDHFGSSNRLRVGDLTWFGGISFEF